ncbi:excinuclease ABC subunit C [Candidatus Saccharibacteria bacterium CG11_big_fil_rev_8_21_14_0_20_41_19]|nr:GIY-YIG nuclease family protein [Candidatus Saccharibacteria bacterium]PIQ70819.1 MAG: excinuclease ABC subunit C [Candidatus Saccharibacteria bacterium CG11_big_fil_rev_8_21_14_0_20_41_19]
MYYVYFLRMNNSQIYTGSTKDLKSRMRLHECGNVTTTSKYLPVILIGYESYILKSDAQRRERYLKTTEGKRLFRQQFRDILNTVRPGSSVDRAEDF